MSKLQRNFFALSLRVSGAVIIGLVDWRLLAGLIMLMIGNNIYIERLRPVVLDPRSRVRKDALSEFNDKSPLTGSRRHG